MGASTYEASTLAVDLPAWSFSIAEVSQWPDRNGTNTVEASRRLAKTLLISDDKT